MTDERNDAPPTIEQERLAAEIRLREAELALKREEFAARLEQQKHEKRSSVSPLRLAVVAAASGIFGSMFGVMTQSKTEDQKFELEMRKVQSSLILEAIKTGSTEQAATNLTFLLEAGLIADPDGRIKRSMTVLSSKQVAPILPSKDGPQKGTSTQ